MPHTTDAEHLQFIFNRLKHVYSENPNYDYMLRFQEIIAKTEQANHTPKMAAPKLEHPDLRGHMSDAIRDAIHDFMGRVISFELSRKMADAVVDQVRGFSQQWLSSQTIRDQKQQSSDAKEETDEPITLRTCSSAQIKTVMERGLHPTKERRDLIFAAGALGNETLQKELGSMELSDFYDGMLAAGLIDVNPYWPRHKKNG